MKFLLILKLSFFFLWNSYAFDSCSEMGNPFDPSRVDDNCLRNQLEKYQQKLDFEIQQLENSLMKQTKPRSTVDSGPNNNNQGRIVRSKYHDRCERHQYGFLGKKKKDQSNYNWCIGFHRNHDICNSRSENKFPNDSGMQGRELSNCMKLKGYNY